MRIMEANQERYLYYFLVLCIFAGGFVRFYGIGAAFLERDETIYLISAIKLNHENPYDARWYNYEHPPIAKWFLGFPTRSIKADYSLTLSIPPEMYVFTYLAPYKEVYKAVRRVSAVFGVFIVILIFLITKEIYGVKAGLWSTTVAALSFDLITYSRITYLDSTAIAFILATIYFYIKHIKTKKSGFLVLTVVSLTLALGTRALFPWLLVPTLIICHFLLNRGGEEFKKNIIFILLILTAVYINFYIVWPSSIYKSSIQHFEAESPLSFPLPFSLKALFFRNSYLFVFALILVVYELSSYLRKSSIGETRDQTKIRIIETLRRKKYSLTELQKKFKLPKKDIKIILEDIGAKNKFEKGKYIWYMSREEESKVSKFELKVITEYFRSSNLSLVIIIFFLIYLPVFGFTKFVSIRYMIFLFLPLFILIGKPLEKASRNNIILMILLALIFINLYGIISWFPYYSEYSNFGVKQYQLLSLREGSYSHVSELEDAISYLNTLGKPPIFTNEHNMLIFYEGKSIPLIAPFEKRCVPNYLSDLITSDMYIVYHGKYGGHPDIREDNFVCQYLREIPLVLVKSFGNYPLEGEKVKIYKIK